MDSLEGKLSDRGMISNGPSEMFVSNQACNAQKKLLMNNGTAKDFDIKLYFLS